MVDHGEKAKLVPASDSCREGTYAESALCLVWDSRFSCLFVYVRGIKISEKFKK